MSRRQARPVTRGRGRRGSGAASQAPADANKRQSMKDRAGVGHLKETSLVVWLFFLFIYNVTVTIGRVTGAKAEEAG